MEAKKGKKKNEDKKDLIKWDKKKRGVERKARVAWEKIWERKIKKKDYDEIELKEEEEMVNWKMEKKKDERKRRWKEK